MCIFLKWKSIQHITYKKEKLNREWIFILLILLLLTVSTNQQNITFFHTSRDKCYLKGEDIIIRSKINISGKLLTLEFPKFEVKLPNSDYHTICSLDLYKCNGYMLSNCYCMTTEDKDIFDVVINITGQVSNSEALLRGKLMFVDQHIYSEVITLPKIYDVPKVKPSLLINDNAINLDLCDKSINGNDVNLVFFLDHSDGIPSRLEIKDHLNRTLKYTHLRTLSCLTKVYGNQTYILSVEFCGSQKYRQSFVCNIIPETNLYFDVCEVLNQNETIFITALIFLSIIMVVSLFTSACLIFKYIVQKRFKKCLINRRPTRLKQYNVEVEKPFVRESVECKLENKDNDNDQEENTTSIKKSKSYVNLVTESSNNFPQTFKGLLNINMNI